VVLGAGQEDEALVEAAARGHVGGRALAHVPLAVEVRLAIGPRTFAWLGGGACSGAVLTSGGATTRLPLESRTRTYITRCSQQDSLIYPLQVLVHVSFYYVHHRTEIQRAPRGTSPVSRRPRRHQTTLASAPAAPVV
jgi:hypothetical protein